VDLTPKTKALKKLLDAMPGAVAHPYVPPRATEPLILMYKVIGKMFAILSVRREEYVIVKCEPELADMLRGKYEGIGHRSHLDKRFWISISLDADVPLEDAKSLAKSSYALVCDGLTRKQKAELATNVKTKPKSKRAKPLRRRA
jgi:predicted DNA-binding protein (MmcQ/YjbR family)